MLLTETTQHHTSLIAHRPFRQSGSRGGCVPADNCDAAAHDFYGDAVAVRLSSFSEDTPGPDDTADADLEDAARAEREYVKERLREELQREPTEEEVDQWLREHTEGY